MSRPLALVTGASSGIGREFVRVLARKGYDQIIVARRLERLTALADELQPSGVMILPLKDDLREAGALQILADAVRKTGRPLDVLVNDAGLGRAGEFSDMASADIDDQMRVNMIAPTHLIRQFLPDMVTRGRGRILNVASIAGYLPGPGMAVYYATKAFVLSLSEALWQETHGTGVTVTALCPGLTHTEFHERAHQAVGRFGWMNADVVADIGVRAMLRGRRVVNAGGLNTLIAIVVHIVPHWLLLSAGHVRRTLRGFARSR